MASHDPHTTIDQQLVSLRDSPVDNDGASDVVLSQIFSYLMAVPPTQPDGLIHWFCGRAISTTVAAATFLIRLFAYSSALVEEWRTKFRKCLNGCAECVQGLQEAKISSQNTYFGAFSADILAGFYRSFEAWELLTILEDINGRTLTTIPPAIAYRILSNLAIFQDPKIIAFIHNEPPTEAIDGWPSNTLPPGILMLLADEISSIRKWAESQASRCQVIPIPRDKFSVSHATALKSLVTAISPVGGESTGFPFATDPCDLWSGFRSVLKLVPVECLQTGVIYQVVNAHLHDTGPHLDSILHCFEHLTRHLGQVFWMEEGPEYPHIIFDAIKENASFLDLLLRSASSSELHPHLSWCSAYLSAIEQQPALPEVVAKMADFLCEELQHERFRDARPAIMLTAVNLFSGLYQRKGFPIMAMSKVFDIHAATLVNVAFSNSYTTPIWSAAKSAACRLVRTILLQDAQAITRAIHSLCHVLAKKQKIDDSDVVLAGSQIWSRTYQTLQPNDGDGMTMIVEVLAQLAHLDILNPKPFGLQKPEQLGVNRALHTVWDGLRDAFARYTDSSRSSSLLNFFQRPRVVEHIYILLLSPIPDIQLSAQSLVGLAFDVDGRQDCYNALLGNHADAALDGLFKALTQFTKYAIVVPEACSLAKHLVRFLPDVVETLCTRPDGLLFNRHFLRPTEETGPCSRLPSLWNCMNQAITVIFKRTPMWANYYENEEMLLWMRDALIYDRDLLAQFRIFESAANRGQDVADEPGTLSKIGQQMADDLQRVLPELTKWLRLSDEELLYQMFELLQSLLNTFHEMRVLPSEASMQKMTKHIQDARKDNTKSRLDSSRLNRLENTLALFIPDEDSVPQKVRETHHIHPVPSKESKKPRKPEGTAGEKPVARSKTSKDDFFTSRDQQALESVNSFPTYRRASAGSSKPRRPSAAPTLSSTHSDAQNSSDEEESQDPATLASLSRMQREPKVRQAPPQRQIKRYDAPIAKNPIQLRLEKRALEARKYQRLKPDVSGLYKMILSWKYLHDGAQPPGPPLTLTHVPADRFADYPHYRQVFEPLLLLECWAQITQSKEEAKDSYRFKINARQFIDDWVDLDMTFNGSVRKEWRLTESDVVLLQHEESCILGKVEAYKTPMNRAIETKIRCVARLDPGLSLDTEWQITPVFSLSTINREYSALLGLPYYDLCPSILQPALPPIPAPNGETVTKIMTLHRVNEPQAVAISSCLDTVGFSLIQGPPGTGKTSTIVAMVMAFLARRPRRIPVPAGKNSKPEAPTGPQILICAPSNAAIDEIAHRLRDSDAFTTKGYNIVRLGAVRSMNQNIVDISLDHLVDNKLDLGKDTGAGSELAALRVDLETVKTQRKEKIIELDSISDNSARLTLLQDEITRLNSKRTSLSKRYDEVKDKQIKESRGLDMSRRAIRLQVLQSAHVICATLSGSGSDILQDLEIEMVIIDEASQATELSALIPLKYQPRHSILVGDPQQLPPTVLSQEASRFRYNESLFVRLQKSSPNSMHLLSIQYRMHPAISRLPSAMFYQARLKDGPDMAAKTAKPWHEDPKFGVYRFLDIKSAEEKSGRSIKNTAECRIAVALFARLRKAFAGTDFDGQVGVISMYRAQIVELRRQFAKEFGSDVLQTVDFNTVDGFQGQEKAIIILSCVRSGPGLESIGFLSDVRRMNVALTRAKSSLFILGNAATLSRSNHVWSSIISDARSHSSLVEVDFSYFTAPSTYVPRTTSPTKPKAQIPVVDAPSDLATPQDLKASIDRRLSTNQISHPPSPSDPPALPPPRPNENLKRKYEVDEPSSSKARKPNVKPRPPRPKDATTAMFIPKKKR
ncbi:SEN1 N terminal-domain-containing protein [Mycena belliarum]|uniref:SEN1 N terminal-domain-containing protein n=1 Tax=Mycena belliarum TaxID=1033014 RepID=A0AAD6XU81_9AGAR|nr:SEN1 N terminal-domain-containing protein [Mycena belliae]